MNFVISKYLECNNQRHMPLLILLGGWLFLITVLAINGAFIGTTGEYPFAILASFATVLSAFSLAYLFSSKVRGYVLSLDMRLLVIMHGWRMIGMGFIMLHLFDHLPGLFAYFAGLGDALTALAAIFLGYALFTNINGVSRKWLLRWNTFGLIDFVIAVSLGVLTRTEAILAPSSGVNSDLMTVFPYVLIPGFFVQLYMLTHIIIFLQLRNNHRNENMIKLTESRLRSVEA